MTSEPILTGPGSARDPQLGHAVVADVMHPGVMSCPPDADLVTVARMMASHHIHAVVVSGIERTAGGGERLTWGLVSDLDLVAAALPELPPDAEAADYASTELVTVDMDERLDRAAQIMVEHQLSHLLVTGPKGMPIGVVSTLDVAGAIAWGEA
jgi:CBS domain-containing protein